ncbi:MAG: dynamin family protein [Candidatus Tectimicrobiota bacterium]
MRHALLTLHSELQQWSGAAFAPLRIRPGVPEAAVLDACEALSADLELLTEYPVLRTGILGGTQVGKSTVFNYLAGGHFAGVSARAAATRWPLALLPGGLTQDPAALVQRLFPLFEPQAWKQNYDVSEASPSGKPLMFYCVDAQGILPQHLVLVDTPDVDSVVEQNGVTAEKVVNNLDVVIAVTTHQKYNDARPTRFFRDTVARHGRATFVVVNQFPFDPEKRGEALHEIMDTLSQQSGLRPVQVYVARATDTAFEDARTLRPFLWPVEPGRERFLKQFFHDLGTATDIKLAAIRGTLQQFDEALGRLQHDTERWGGMAESAMRALDASVFTPALTLSMPPSALIFAEFGRWARQRNLLSAVSLHSLHFFDWVGDVVLLRRLRTVDTTSLLKQWAKIVEAEVNMYLSAVHANLSAAQPDPVATDACQLIRDNFTEVRRQVLDEVRHRILGLELPDAAEVEPSSQETLRREFALEFHTLLDTLYDSPEHSWEIDRVLFWVKTYSYARPAVTAAMLVTGIGASIEVVQQAAIAAAQQAALAVTKQAAAEAAKQAAMTAAKQAVVETAQQAAIAAAKQATAEAAKAAALSLGETVAVGAAGGTTGSLMGAYTGEGFKAVIRWLLVGGHTALIVAMQNLVFASLAAADAYVEARTAVAVLNNTMEQRTARLAGVRAQLDGEGVEAEGHDQTA